MASIGKPRCRFDDDPMVIEASIVPMNFAEGIGDIRACVKFFMLTPLGLSNTARCIDPGEFPVARRDNQFIEKASA